MPAPETPSPVTTDRSEPERRPFFRWITYALGLIAAGVGVIPILAFFVRVRPHPVEWVDLGAMADFPVDETRLVTFENPIRVPWDGDVAQTGVYVRNQGEPSDEGDARERFLILAMNCAHLGCGVEWFPESGLFMCPCHGGVYYETGERASGPPPRGLYRCVWRIEKGRVQIQAPHYPTLQDPLRDRAQPDAIG